MEELTEEANQLQFRNGELSERLAAIRVDMGLPAQEAEEERVQRRAGERPKALMQVNESRWVLNFLAILFWPIGKTAYLRRVTLLKPMYRVSNQVVKWFSIANQRFHFSV